MNICFYTILPPNPFVGGVERVTCNLTKYFISKGIGVYSLTSRGEDDNSAIPKDVSQKTRLKFIVDFIRRNHIEIIIDQYGTEPLLQHPHIPEDVKIIHCYHLDPGAHHVIRSLLETFSFRTLKYSLLNLLFVLNTPRRRTRFKREIKKKLDGGVDKVVYLSPDYVKTIRNIIKADSNLLTYIPNAVDDRLLNLPNFSNEKDKIVMWCGRIVHNHKNILFLPRLWNKLAKLHPDWKMVVVGDGIDRDLLERRIKKYNLKNIILTGNTDPFPYYKKASIFVSPSFNEGYPMVIIEAMAHSCVPVVFNSCPAYSDIIDNGKSGYIVPDMDENAFIDACDRLMADTEKCVAMGANAKRCVQKISLDRVGAMWFDLFGNLIGKRS